MPPRWKKFVGLMAMLLWLAVYAILVTGAAIRLLPGAPWPLELGFYAVAGLAWALPLLPLIYWMNRA